jgi:hypothetical protein
VPNLENQIIEKPLHVNAQNTIVGYTNEFTDALLLQSKTLATLEGTDEVQSVHVEKAKTIVLTLTQKKNRSRDALIVLGSLFLGIALQGMFGEFSSANPRASYFLFYSIMGIISAILFVVGIYKS